MCGKLYCISHSYVDDTKLQISFKLQNKDIAVVEMNEDLRKACNWCFTNYLLLNPDKSTLIVFTRKMLQKLRDITLFGPGPTVEEHHNPL